MSAFARRLRFAVSNYAGGALTYKAFAGLIDLPYRTLQNYLSGERSPNVEALEKLARNGLNVNWLVTGQGTPYTITELEKPIRDKLFLLHAKSIIKHTFATKNEFFDRQERYRVLSFLMSNNYLRIGDILHELLDDPDVFPSLSDMENALAKGELDGLFDPTPNNGKELWKAIQIAKEIRTRELVPPRAVDEGWPASYPEDEVVGE
ncbi:helix-turn-helix transcriptional regulator [Agrobacterium tumefaciens]|nr:helix-turn-helix transcriptional regulator [Agrobacterium tumefaciens]